MQPRLRLPPPMRKGCESDTREDEEEDIRGMSDGGAAQALDTGSGLRGLGERTEDMIAAEEEEEEAALFGGRRRFRNRQPTGRILMRLRRVTRRTRRMTRLTKILTAT